MKILITEENYSHMVEWPEGEDEQRPSAEEVVESTLYLLTFLFNPDAVEKAAKGWNR